MVYAINLWYSSNYSWKYTLQLHLDGFFSNPLLWCIGEKKQLLVGMLVVLCILDDFWISEVAEHSVMDCGGVKGLELKDLHLCDGQAFWDWCQLQTNN